ncbi:MAG: Na+/H+ antiporter NhaC family protein [Bdellovibrionota bacterium]
MDQYTGAIFGDHISPISDTTIMSSIWGGIDHMDHVQSQLPYALVVGTLSVLIWLRASRVWRFALDYFAAGSCCDVCGSENQR